MNIERHCALCSYSTLKKCLMRRHMINSHLEANTFVSCDFCGAKLRRSRNLMNHILSKHTTEKLWRCEQCDCGFKTPCSLRGHLRRKHAPPYSCSECDYTTCEKPRLAKHIAKHQMGLKYYKCDHCKFSTYEEHTLQRHQIRHEGPKPYICPICGKRFTLQRGLDQHKNFQHSTGPPRFECNKCNVKFKQNSHLTRHVKLLHSTFKTNKICKHCKQEFSTSYDFKKHRKLHVGVVISCNLCDYSTKYRQAMKMHKMKHDNIKPYACDYCSKECRRPHLLRKHKEAHHPNLA